MVGVLIIVCFMFVFDIKYWLDQTVQTMNYPVEYKREQMIDYFLCTSPFWKDCLKKFFSNSYLKHFLKNFPLWKDFYFRFFLITIILLFFIWLCPKTMMVEHIFFLWAILPERGVWVVCDPQKLQKVIKLSWQKVAKKVFMW